MVTRSPVVKQRVKMAPSGAEGRKSSNKKTNCDTPTTATSSEAGGRVSTLSSESSPVSSPGRGGAKKGPSLKRAKECPTSPGETEGVGVDRTRRRTRRRVKTPERDTIEKTTEDASTRERRGRRRGGEKKGKIATNHVVKAEKKIALSKSSQEEEGGLQGEMEVVDSSCCASALNGKPEFTSSTTWRLMNLLRLRRQQTGSWSSVAGDSDCSMSSQTDRDEVGSSCCVSPECFREEVGEITAVETVKGGAGEHGVKRAMGLNGASDLQDCSNDAAAATDAKMMRLKGGSPNDRRSALLSLNHPSPESKGCTKLCDVSSIYATANSKISLTTGSVKIVSSTTIVARSQNIHPLAIPALVAPVSVSGGINGGMRTWPIDSGRTLNTSIPTIPCPPYTGNGMVLPRIPPPPNSSIGRDSGTLSHWERSMTLSRYEIDCSVGIRNGRLNSEYAIPVWMRPPGPEEVPVPYKFRREEIVV